MNNRNSPFKYGKPVWEWHRWERFKDALRYWILEAWLDCLLDHPMLKAVLEVALTLLAILASIAALAGLWLEGYIPRSWW